jgi:MYXO-CTERM domain-containing protein
VCGSSCTTKADCDIGFYCSTGKCIPTLPLGTPCTDPESCGSGICADGVCCNSLCVDQCEACDVPTTKGQCVAVTGVPHNGRTACAGDGSACQGTCDGSNRKACLLPGSTTQCRPPSCKAGVATLPENCRGDGTCPAVETQDCAPSTCGGNQCVGNCVVDAECVAGDYCSAGVCVKKVADGTTCSDDRQCGSGHCTDGFCCNSACGGQCQACDVSGSEGKCTAVKGPPHKGREACVSDGSACAGSCDGTNVTACSYPAAGVACRDPSCANDIATLGAQCTGTGVCPPEQQQACAPGKCAGVLCDGGCLADGDCSLTEYCSAGTCAPKIDNGQKCAASDQCTSGACVDGYCCNSSCNGQCEACNVSGKEGSCTAVTGSPRGVRPACDSDGSACGGKCDGKVRDGCTYPGSEVVCRNAACTNNAATLEARCNKEGSCPTAQFQPCAPFTCGSALCAGDCTVDGDCQTGNFCSGGVCQPKLPPASPCGANVQCANGICADGFCCDSTCDSQCQACDVPGSEGTCTTLMGELPRGGRAACGGQGQCAATCSGAATCGFPGAEHTCGTGSCTAGVELPAPICSGSGSCLPAVPKGCGAYQCANGVCPTKCFIDDDCVPGLVCLGSVCTQPVPDAGAEAGAGGAPDMTPDASTGGTGGITETDAGPDASDDASDDASGNSQAGEAGQAGTSSKPHSVDKGSCGCRVPGTPAPTPLPLLAGLGLALYALRRRTRRHARGADARP